MAIVKITELPAATSPVNPSNVAAVVQDGVTKKAAINELGYAPAGQGAAIRTIQDKLRDVISVKDFGAVGDGVTDDSAALQAAINAAAGATLYIPEGSYYYTSLLNINSGMTITGDGFGSHLKPSTPSGNNIFINASNVLIEKIRMQGSSPGGFAIGPSATAGQVKNITFQNCAFLDIGQAVWTWTTSEVTVQNCLFDNVTYGVIQQAGRVSNFVLVDGCIARNVAADFVEANGTSSAPSEGWTITNNIFEGSNSYPSTATEERFVGITAVKNVIITGNNVQKSAGDAAIHLEDILGETIIANNIFDNCITSAGNNGYIYLLNAAENCIIEGNMFFRTDATLPPAVALDVSSGVYTNDIQFIGNRIVGNGATGNFGGIFGAFNQNDGRNIITNNFFESLTTAFSVNVFLNVIFSNNYVINCNGGIIYPSGLATGGGLQNYVVTGNFFVGTVGSQDIRATTNTSGTFPPKNWLVNGNVFSKQVSFSDSGGGGANNASELVVTNNVFSSTAALSLSVSGGNIVNFGNVFQASGNNSATAFGLSNFADDTAAAAGGIQVGGMYRNGSVVQIRVS